MHMHCIGMLCDTYNMHMDYGKDYGHFIKKLPQATHGNVLDFFIIYN